MRTFFLLTMLTFPNIQEPASVPEPVIREVQISPQFITGKVVMWDESPVGSAIVTLLIDQNRVEETSTDYKGKFILPVKSDILNKDVEIAVSLTSVDTEGNFLLDHALKIRYPGQSGFVIRISRDGNLKVSGRISKVDLGGSHCEVLIARNDPIFARTRAVKQDGIYSIEGLWPGNYKLFVYCIGDNNPQEREIKLDNKDLELNIEFPPNRQ